MWEGRAQGLLLCFLFQTPQRLGGLGECMAWGTGSGAHGARRLPKRGAPRGLSNLRMVKRKGQSQVRQPTRRLLQSGTGSAGPPPAPSTRGMDGSKQRGTGALSAALHRHTCEPQHGVMGKDQQVKGGFPAPLPCPGEAPSAVLRPVLGSPGQER